MRLLFYLILLSILVGCSSNKNVYWCGDHACINKKEREAYFKKTMIVEIRTIGKDNEKDESQFEIIEKTFFKKEKNLAKKEKLEKERRLKEEKKLEKLARLNEKKRIEDEKDLAKIARLEEKRKIKEEKNLAKKEKLEKERRLKEEKKLEKLARLEEKKYKKEKKKLKKKEPSKKSKNDEIKINAGIAEVSFSTKEFNELFRKITKKNMFRPYPNINDIPE